MSTLTTIGKNSTRSTSMSTSFKRPCLSVDSMMASDHSRDDRPNLFSIAVIDQSIGNVTIQLAPTPSAIDRRCSLPVGSPYPLDEFLTAYSMAPGVTLNRFSGQITVPKSQGNSQAMLYATGIKDEAQMQLPQVGISSVWWEGNPCTKLRLIELT